MITPPPDETGNGPVISTSGGGALVDVVDVVLVEVVVGVGDGVASELVVDVLDERMGMSGAEVDEAIRSGLEVVVVLASTETRSAIVVSAMRFA